MVQIIYGYNFVCDTKNLPFLWPQTVHSTLQPPAPLVKVVTNNKLSDTVSTDKSQGSKKGSTRGRPSTAPARGKENRNKAVEQLDGSEVCINTGTRASTDVSL